MKLDGTHHLTLTVVDLDRTCEWYRSVLGFRDVVRYRNDSIDADCHVLAYPGAAPPTIGLRQYDTQDGSRFDEHRIGLDHLAFDVGDDESLSQWHEHLGRVGVPFATTCLPELSITVIRDPDNIQIELCATNASPVGSSIDENHVTVPRTEQRPRKPKREIDEL
ncbi:MAG: VOC family protein [Actinomycetota bacterium]|nr:VOC family protein [Actinomycetota bacterium]